MKAIAGGIAPRRCLFGYRKRELLDKTKTGAFTRPSSDLAKRTNRPGA
jgi:hypothetical protein